MDGDFSSWALRAATKLAASGLYCGIVCACFLGIAAIAAFSDDLSGGKKAFIFGSILISFPYTVIPAALKSDERRDALKRPSHKTDAQN